MKPRRSLLASIQAINMTLSAHAAMPVLAHAISRAFAFKNGYLTYATDGDGHTDFFLIQDGHVSPRHCASLKCDHFLDILTPGTDAMICYEHFDPNQWKQTRQTVILTGAFHAHDLTDLLTCLNEQTVYFIPSQIGLPFLQDNADAAYEFQPWHKTTLVGAAHEHDKQHAIFIAWDTIRPFLRHVLEHGYDEEAATQSYKQSLLPQTNTPQT